MDEMNYLNKCDQSDYEALMSLALSTEDESTAKALEEVSYEAE